MILLSSIADPIRDALQARADHLSVLVGWANITVAIGVALEGIEICHDIGAWAKRKSREKRELIVLKELAEIFPVSKAKRATESHSDEPRWVKRLLRIGLMIVVFGVVGEWRCGAKLEDAHNAIHKYDVAKLTAAEKAAADAATSARIAHEEADAVKGIADEARADAKDALAKAQAAQRELAHAETDAAKAQTVASKALSTADKAESHLADALQRASKAEAQLNRLKTPRSLVHSDELITALKPFNGTEYTLNVFMDDESMQFTKVVAGALEGAGWVRRQQSGIILGIPTMEIVFDQGAPPEHVPACLDTGISLHAHTKESLAALQSRPIQSLPKTIQAALVLKSAIALNISPPDERNVVSGVIDPKPEEGIPITICVGKKP
jgi:hypothetical protein